MKYQTYAAPVVRISLSFLFLWFGISQINNPLIFAGYAPAFLSQLPISLQNFLFFNGVAEVLLSIVLLVGVYTRIVAAVLFLHLIGIALGIGYNDIAIRDWALALVTLSVALHGPDQYCWESRKK